MPAPKAIPCERMRCQILLVKEAPMKAALRDVLAPPRRLVVDKGLIAGDSLRFEEHTDLETCACTESADDDGG